VSDLKKIVKAVIPAAGFGTRMLPATKAVPKEILPVAGKPLIQYAVEEAAASGIETVILVIRNLGSAYSAATCWNLPFGTPLDKRIPTRVARFNSQML